MRSIYFLIAAGLLLTVSCTKSNNTLSSDSIGGDGNLPTNAVGYTYSGSTDAPGVTFNKIVVASSDNTGAITLSVNATLPATASTLTSLIPAQYKDASGDLSVTISAKNTSDGILDYSNLDHKPFVIVNYSSNVGDKYILHKSNGETITRTVTAKSTTDDYPYGLMYIKTITVEQDSRMPGISKIRYIANHKFGLVAVVFVMEDGTATTINIM